MKSHNIIYFCNICCNYQSFPAGEAHSLNLLDPSIPVTQYKQIDGGNEAKVILKYCTVSLNKSHNNPN